MVTSWKEKGQSVVSKTAQLTLRLNTASGGCEASGERSWSSLLSVSTKWEGSQGLSPLPVGGLALSCPCRSTSSPSTAVTGVGDSVTWQHSRHRDKTNSAIDASHLRHGTYRQGTKTSDLCRLRLVARVFGVLQASSQGRSPPLPVRNALALVQQTANATSR